MDVEEIIQGVLNGEIGTSCCPEIDEVFQRYRKGEASIEELREAIIKKWSEIHG